MEGGAPPPIETVCAAIETLYHNPDPREKERASNWLQDLQKSVFAWKVADELLHRKGTVSTESCYIAAQTMRTKIQNSFYELPLESHISLRDSLLEHVNAVNEETNSVIVTQLCLAIADLALLMGPQEWPDAVRDLSTRLLASGRTWPLLEILIVLPEEVNSRHLRLGENRREDMTKELRQGAQIVTDFLHACLNNQAQHNQQYKVNVFKCFTSWLALGVISLDGIESHPVIVEAFRCLSNVSEASSSIHEAGTDLICTLLVRMETDEAMSPNQHSYQSNNISGRGDDNSCGVISNMHNTMSSASIQRLEGYIAMGHRSIISITPVNCIVSHINGKNICFQAAGKKISESIFTAVRGLEEAYHLSVANEDMEKCLNLCRVFTELGETMLNKIVNHSPTTTTQTGHFAVAIFDCVLICCGHPDYEIPDITFNLWFRLSEELYQRNDDRLTNSFRPYIERLINALAKHCQMEPDSDGILEEGEDFSEFRSRVVELIKDVVFIVGSANVFSHMFAFLRSTSAGLGSATNDNPSGLGWEVGEAALFVMCAVARNLVPMEAGPEETSCVSQVIDAVVGLPASAHTAIRHTSIRLIGELAEWICHHPEYLERILEWLVVGLRNPRTASETAKALEHVCSQCQNHMIRHLDGLLQILSSLDNLGLKPMAATGLIKGVSLILSRMAHDDISRAMKAICALQLTPIQTLVQRQRSTLDNSSSSAAENGKINKNTQNDPVLYLDRLAAILRHVNPPNMSPNIAHPCTETVINDIWPVVSTVCEVYASDARIMERTCRTIRFAVRCLGVQSAPLLEPLVKQMVSLYQRHPHSCFLYLGSILVDEYAHLGSNYVEGLLQMLVAFLPPTFVLLIPQDSGGNLSQQTNGVLLTMRNHPDTVDDFFRLNARFLQRAALPYLKFSQFSSVVECALMAASLDHRDANASVMKFFFDLLHAARNEEDRDDFDERSSIVSKVRENFGAKIVDSLIRAVVFSLPSYTYHDVGDVLFELMILERSKVCLWLEASLMALHDTQPGHQVQQNGDHANLAAKVTKEQLVKFHKEVTSSEQPSNVIGALKNFSRLWR